MGPVGAELPRPPPPAPPADMTVPPSIHAEVEAVVAGGQTLVPRTYSDLASVPVPASGRDLISWPPGQPRKKRPYLQSVGEGDILDAAAECRAAWREELAAQSAAAAARPVPAAAPVAPGGSVVGVPAVDVVDVEEEGAYAAAAAAAGAGEEEEEFDL